MAHDLGELAFGVTVTQYGLRIRVRMGTEDAVKKAMDPVLAKLIGDELMQCKKTDGIVLHACGLPHNMADAEVVKALTIQPMAVEGQEPKSAAKPWTCAPFAFHSRSEWGKKTLVVKALSLPRSLQLEWNI